MKKYSNTEIYFAIMNYGTDNFMRLFLGEEKYKDSIEHGTLKLEYRHWGERTPNIPFRDTMKKIENLNSRGNAAINIHWTPFLPKEYGWIGYEYEFDSIAAMLLDFTFDEKMELIHKYNHNPEFFKKNINKDYKFDAWYNMQPKIHLDVPRETLGFLYHFTSLGTIDLGSAYAIINRNMKIEIPLNSNGQAFNVAIETKYPITDIIFTVEKDGLVLAQYNLIDLQDLKTLNEAIFISPDEQKQINYYHKGGFWHVDYGLPLCTTLNSGIAACEENTFEAMNQLEKVLNYLQKNGNDAKTLELAIELIRDYTGYMGMR